MALTMRIRNIIVPSVRANVKRGFIMKPLSGEIIIITYSNNTNPETGHAVWVFLCLKLLQLVRVY